MFKHIIKNEFRNPVADKTLAIVAVLFAVSIGYAMFNGFAWTNFQNKTIAEVKADEQKRHDEIKTRIAELEKTTPTIVSRFSDPRDVASAGRNTGQRFAVMPPNNFAPFSIGQSDLLPYYFKISTRSQTTFINNDDIENPTNLLTGRFDISFVIIYLLPLLILAVSYNFLSAEREAGILQMLLAQPVALRQFIVGKITVRFLIIVVPVIFFSLIAYLLNGGNLFAEDTFLRFGLWSLAVVVYSIFWFGTVILVNSFNWKSSTNALALAGLWLFFVVLLPSLASVFVTTVYPVPSRIEMINATREAAIEANAKGSQLMAKYMEDHPELMQGNYDPNDAAMKTYITQNEVDGKIKPILENYDTQLQNQQNLVKNIRFVSPAISMQEILNDIAGTGNARQQSFLQQVKTYHQTWQNYFIPRVFTKQRLDIAVYENSPKFVWQEESTDEIAKRVSGGLLGVLVSGVVLTFLGLSTIRRYSVI